MDEYCLDELLQEVISRLEQTNGIEFVSHETIEKVVNGLLFDFVVTIEGK